MRILLEAPIFTRSGYGEHSRFIYRALRENIENLEVFVNALNWGTTSWTYSDSPEAHEMQHASERFLKYESACKEEGKPQSYDIQIHVGLPSEFEKKAGYSVCVTAGIETDKVSFEWLARTHRGIDKIIVPSEHAAIGFRETNYEAINTNTNTKTQLTCGCPVEVIPYPVKSLEKGTESLDIELLPDFNFLTVALLGPRKNLEKSVQLFIEEFRENPDVGLLIKTSTSRASLIDRAQTKGYLESLLDSCGPRKCKVYFLHGDLTDQQMQLLYTHPKVKCYMTATRGEGYGLPIFESAYNGLPIIATDWSGHLDFLIAPYKDSKNKKEKNRKLFLKVDYTLEEVGPNAIWKDIIVEGSRWATIKEKSFREQLSKVHKNYGIYKKWAKSLQESISETHSAKKIKEKMFKAMIPEEIIKHFSDNDSWAKELEDVEVV